MIAHRLLSSVVFLGALTSCWGGHRAQIDLSVSAPTGFNASQLSLHVLDRGYLWTWSPIAGAMTAHRDIGTSGRARIAVRAVHQGVEVFSSELELSLREDWRWEYHILIAPTTPAVRCFGCGILARYPVPESLQTEPGQSFWVMVAGKSLDQSPVF